MNTVTPTEEQDVRVIAANIEHLIQMRGWNWSQLADIADVSQPTISRLKNAKFEPGVFTIRRIAEALDTSVDWLCQPHDAKILATAS